MDDWMIPADHGELELVRRLEAFADLRLALSGSATTRLRTSVMTAAHRRAALMEADAARDAATANVELVAEQARLARGSSRRPVAALLAACLTLGIVAGTAFAAGPGGPLYAGRLWIETASLPADPMARANAEVSRLEERLREAQQASRDGNGTAAQAALAAYSAIVAEAESGTGGDPAANAVIGATVTRHVAVLTLLLDSVPVAARDAIEHAIASSSKVLEDLKATGGNGGNGGQSGQPGNPGQPGSAGQPTDSGQPGKPASTPRPDKPDDTGQPVKPEMTDKPAVPGSDGPSGRDAPDRDH